jgi:hypothetical protein
MVGPDAEPDLAKALDGPRRERVAVGVEPGRLRRTRSKRAGRGDDGKQG